MFVYDEKTLKKLQEFSWEHDGWGITHNGTDLIISTGESNLYFVDPQTFKIKRLSTNDAGFAIDDSVNLIPRFPGF